MTIDDEALERALRTELRRRDPGPAPERLRQRVRRVTTPRASRSSVALRAAASIVLLVGLGVSVAAWSQHRESIQLGGGVQATPALPGQPVGPAGAPLLPILPPALLTAAAWAIVVLFRSWGLFDPSPDMVARLGLEASPPRSRRWLRPAAGVLVAVALVSWRLLTIPGLAWGGGSYGPASELLVKSVEPDPAVKGSPAFYFSFAANGSFATEFTITNVSPLPIHLTGWSTDVRGPFYLDQLRLPPVIDESGSTPPYADSVPFRPVELAPGGQVALYEVWRFLCVDLSDGAIESVDTITLRYDFLGIPRDEIVTLPFAVALAGPLSCPPGTPGPTPRGPSAGP